MTLLRRINKSLEHKKNALQRNFLILEMDLAIFLAKLLWKLDNQISLNLRFET